MIFENIANALAEQFEVDPASITMETSLIDDLGADSLDVVELIMSLEEMYNITISDEDAMQLDTVGKIIDYLEHMR
ncbi:MAG: acyl carrier protein [Eubacteriales bacterium]|nr:acyl carrier protein [Eubacteriales bacterium]